MASANTAISRNCPAEKIISLCSPNCSRPTNSLLRAVAHAMGIQMLHDGGFPGEDTLHVIHASTDPV